MKKLIIGIVVGIVVGMLGTAYASNIGDNKKITIYTDEETKMWKLVLCRFKDCRRGRIKWIGEKTLRL